MSSPRGPNKKPVKFQFTEEHLIKSKNTKYRKVDWGDKYRKELADDKDVSEFKLSFDPVTEDKDNHLVRSKKFDNISDLEGTPSSPVAESSFLSRATQLSASEVKSESPLENLIKVIDKLIATMKKGHIKIAYLELCKQSASDPAADADEIFKSVVKIAAQRLSSSAPSVFQPIIPDTLKSLSKIISEPENRDFYLSIEDSSKEVRTKQKSNDPLAPLSLIRQFFPNKDPKQTLKEDLASNKSLENLIKISNELMERAKTNHGYT